MPDHTPFNPASPVNTSDIHLWQLDLSDVQQTAESCLDQDEQTRFHDFAGSAQARRYLASRCAMRQIIGQYLGIEPQDVQFSIQQAGKPVIAPADCDLHFNLTHTGDVGLLVVARGMAVGVDIEQIRSMKHKQSIARRTFEPTEVKALAETPEAEQDEHFFRLWTCMEARQKCKGHGIFGFKVSSQSVGMHQFIPIPGYCAALAWEDLSVQPSLQFFTYSAQ